MFQKIKYFSFIIFELILLVIIILLGIQIIKIRSDNVKGAQFVNLINKNELIFASNSGELKYFYEPKPNSEEHWNPIWLDHEVTNHINSDSFNESKDYKIERDNQTYRIITLGDSFTYGHYIDSSLNYSKVLERRLNQNSNCTRYKKFEVINMGVPGYDVSYTINRFEKRGLKYKPDLVIWLLNPWNFDIYNDLIIPEKERLTNNGVLNFDQTTKKYVAALRAEENIKNKYGFDYMYYLSANNLLKINIIYTGKLLFTTLNKYPDKYMKIISKIEVNNKINHLNLFLDYETHNDLKLLDGHPNQSGHKKIADELFKYISSHYLKNC